MTDPLDPTHITFQPVREQDIPLVYRWRCLPHVRQWWRDDPYETIAGKLTRRVRGAEPVSCFLILYDAAPIGYIHTYHISDFPDAAARVGPDGGHAAGIDLFIGDVRYLHRGLGAPLIRAFVRRIVFADPAVESCLIGPDPTNTAAIRAYAKAGFRYLKTIPGERPDESEYLMRLVRSELAHSRVTTAPERPWHARWAGSSSLRSSGASCTLCLSIMRSSAISRKCGWTRWLLVYFQVGDG